MKEQLPKYTKNQAIGNRSATVLKAIMQKHCLFTDVDQEQDLGIDFIGTVLKGEYPSDKNFNAQCKGSDDVDLKLNATGTEFCYPIKVSTLNYWKQKRDVTFLFLVDEENECVYWTAPLNEIEGKDISEQKSFTCHIPKTNIINSKTSELPESFSFEIIRYYANYAEPIIRQLNNITKDLSSNIEYKNMLELMNTLERNFKAVEQKHKEVMDGLIKKIKSDLSRIFYYCQQLDYMTEVVNTYCPNGIYATPFGDGKGMQTVHECKEKIDSLIQNADVSYEELFELSKEVFELKGNYLGFYREMVYEDNPFGNHDDIEKEFDSWIALKRSNRWVNN